MEDLDKAIALLAILGFIAFLAMLKFRWEMSQRQMLFDAQKQLLVKVSNQSATLD